MAAAMVPATVLAADCDCPDQPYEDTAFIDIGTWITKTNSLSVVPVGGPLRASETYFDGTSIAYTSSTYAEDETYPNGIWAVTLCYINNVTSGTMSATISDFDEASQTEIPIASGNVFIPKPSVITKECVVIDAAPVDSYPYYTVQAGHTLRLQLTYESDDDSSLWLGSDSDNLFCSRMTTPVPELSTMLLFGSGLVFLAGLILLRNRKKRPTPAV